MRLTDKVERPKSLTDLAMGEIRDSIVMGRLQFGDALSETGLAASLGISKTPVREALLRLKLEGLVDIHPQRGTYVFQPSEAEVVQICQFRAIVESEALADGMRNNPQSLIQSLDTCLQDMGAAFSKNHHHEFPQLDTRFHNAIVENCANVYLQAAYGLISAQITALRYRLPAENSQVTHCQENHGVVVQAIREGKTSHAQKILREHIHNTENAYLIASQRRTEAAPPAG
jgi:DNA-binding GntR family transcriptional regulator